MTTGIELDDLRAQWTAQDAKLQSSLRLNVATVRDTLAGNARRALRPLAWHTNVEVLLNAVMTLAFGAFAADHLGEMRFAAPALVLLVVWIGLLVDGVRQRFNLDAIDFGGSVADVQTRLAALGDARVRNAKWIALVSPALWIPLLVVGLKGLFDVDATELFSGTYVLVNVAAWVGWVVVLLVVARVAANRRMGSPLLQRLFDDLSGRGVVRARTFADALAYVENDDAAAQDYALGHLTEKFGSGTTSRERDDDAGKSTRR